MQHCMSSQCVLIQYRRCSDAKCAVCTKVRELIRKVNYYGGQVGVLIKDISGRFLKIAQVKKGNRG